MGISFRIILLLACVIAAWPACARTDLQLPRFVSLKSDEVNVRTGPGLRYQIKWVIRRNGLPLEVIAEYEQWRKVKDIDGDDGWLHSSMLSNERSAMVIAEGEILRKDAAADAEPVAKIEKGAIAELLECTREFCRLHTGDYKGWVNRQSLWGIYPEEWQE